MVSVLGSKTFGINKSIGIGFEKNWCWIFLFLASFYLFWTINFDLKSFRFGFETFPCFLMVSVSKKNWSQKKYWYRFRKNLVSKKVSVSVSKKFGIEKSIGIGIGKNLVSKKVSDSVSKKIGIGKKFRIRFRSDFGFRHTLITTTINSIIIASIIFFKARE